MHSIQVSSSTWKVEPGPSSTRVSSYRSTCCAESSCGYSIVPQFADAEGKVINGEGLGFLESHVAAPNSRKSGLWRHVFCEIPRSQGATQFVGFANARIARSTQEPHFSWRGRSFASPECFT